MNLYFQEPRFKLNFFNDFLIRVLVYVFYSFLIISLPFLLLSDLSSLRWLGVFIGLFLLDRLLHLNEADKSLVEYLRIKNENKKENVLYYLTPKSRKVLVYSYYKAKILKQNPLLIFLKELINEKEIKEILKRLEIDERFFVQKIDGYLEDYPFKGDYKEMILVFENLAKSAFEEALVLKEKFVELRNFLPALLNFNDLAIVKLFQLFNLTKEDLKAVSIFGVYHSSFFSFKKEKLPTVIGGFGRRPYKLRKRIMNREWTARPTPTLDEFSIDLTSLARTNKAGFMIGHEEEFESLINILSRANRTNALLLGDSSSGKTTIVAHLAFCLIKDLVPKSLFDKRLISLDLGNLISEADTGVLAERLKKIMDEVYYAGNVILHFPSLSDFLKNLEKNGLNAFDIILPVLKADVVPVVAEVNYQEFNEILNKRKEVAEIFDVVKVEEISQEEAVKFLIYQSLILEKKSRVISSYRAIKKAVELAYRYLRPKLLPASADDLLKLAFARAEKEGLRIISESLVIRLVEEIVEIPLSRVTEEESEKLINLEKIIHQFLINQEQAVKAVAEALRQYRAGLSRKSGPIASFLFVGPTGVGKTELAKILSRINFGSEEAMIRFDMSEFQEKESLKRFLGTANEGMVSSVTEMVLQKPYSLILLDEFEKAHPEILNIFLQVFDDGRLTDYLGRTVDFRNTIIIATSNAHSDFIKEELEKGKKVEEISEVLKKKLTNFFRPELLNRFSDIIVFRSLNLGEINLITQLQLKEIIKTLKENQGIDLEFDEEVIKKISELGYDPIFGARPLRKVINEKIKSLLTEKILKKEIDRGNVVKIVLENNNFVLKVIA